MTWDGNCYEGLEDSPYYDFYAAYGWYSVPHVDVEVVMISEGQACDSDSYTIDFGFYDVNDCARAVVEHGYQFFSHDPNDGECRYEMTMDGTCQEGLYDSPYYDFYAAYGWSSMPPLHVVMISEGNACDAYMNTIDFGYYDLEECARAVVEAGFQYFHQDPNDGECLWVETVDGNCYEGFYESEYYDFYAAYGWEPV